MLLNCGVGEDSWESLGLPINPQGNQSWLFFGRTDVEAETPILWPPDAKSWLIWKDPDAGKDWRQEEKGMTEDEMVGCHHRWIWVWVSSRSWWWTGNPGMLQSMGLQRVGHDLVTKQPYYINATHSNIINLPFGGSKHKRKYVSWVLLSIVLLPIQR